MEPIIVNFSEVVTDSCSLRDSEQQKTVNAIYVHVVHFVKDMGPVNAQEFHCEQLKALDGKIF